jgi:hypothetical protein
MGTTEIQLHAPGLPADPASPSYADLVAAWHEADSRSAWFRARLAAVVAEEDLRRYAADVGVAHSTVKSYRAVARAYDAANLDVQIVAFGVAAAFMGLEDRLELVSRAEPWTVAEARDLAAARAQRALPSAKRRRGRPRKRPEQETGQPGGSEPPGGDGRPPVGPGRAADGTGTDPGAQEAAGEPGQLAPADGQAAPDSAAPEMPAIPAGDAEGAAWQVLCEPYQALPGDQRGAFLGWVPELVQLNERLHDPAWLGKRLAWVLERAGADGQATAAGPAADGQAHQHLWAVDEKKRVVRCTVPGCGLVQSLDKEPA